MYTFMFFSLEKISEPQNPTVQQARPLDYKIKGVYRKDAEVLKLMVWAEKLRLSLKMPILALNSVEFSE